MFGGQHCTQLVDFSLLSDEVKITTWVEELRVTVPHQFAHGMVFFRVLDDIPELAELFTHIPGDSNFIALTTRQIIDARWVLRPRRPTSRSKCSQVPKRVIQKTL